jgi:hypothetical protein
MTILFIDLAYELTKEGLIFYGPFWGFLLIILFFTCYFIHPILGIGFINDLNKDQDIAKWKITLFWIVFPIQLIFQLFVLYNTIDAIQGWVQLLKSGNSLFYRDLIPAFVGTIACIATVYLEIFTFPLIKLVKKNYRAVLDQLNYFGSPEFHED